MTDTMQGLLADAKKNKFSLIKDNLSEDDIASVWEYVSAYIEKQMSQQKGVQIATLGTFTFTQKKLDIGNNKFILIQRPVFNISEKLAQNQALQYVKHHVPGHIPVVQLNYAAMSFESPYDRDTVENCVREILNSAQRAVGSKRNVELSFNGIGKLSIRDSKVKMKFYKDFINQMDGSGKLLDSLQNRPGTVDSVMSDRSVSRPGTSNTVILPKISSTNVNNTGGLAPLPEHMEEEEVNMDPQRSYGDMNNMAMVAEDTLPTNINAGDAEEGMQGYEDEDVDTAAAIRNIEMEGEPAPLGMAAPAYGANYENEKPDPTKRASIPPSRAGSRMAAPMAMATGVSLLDDLVPSAATPKSAPSPALQRPSPPPGDYIGLNVQNSLVLDSTRRRNSHSAGRVHSTNSIIYDSSLMKPHPPAQLAPLHRSYSLDQMKPGEEVHTPPASACGHSNAGQELCYLCHQRARRNIPVTFTEERRRREEEEDRLLQQYQYMKDAENILSEQEMNMSKRHNLQKMAVFNLGVSEAIHTKKRSRDTEFHKSYLFQRRPLTPPRIIKQEEYSGALSKQVGEKETVAAKRRSDEEFLERLEQVQLAEDLAVQREQFMMEKADEQDRYKKALEAQLRINHMLSMEEDRSRCCTSGRESRGSGCSSVKAVSLPGHVRLPSLPQPKNLRPFSEPSPARMNEEWKPFFGRLRFKPLQVPAREPDREVFGKNDMTNEKMAERRRRAYELFKDQQDLVAQRKREAILKRLAEQKDEENVLDRTKNEMLEDRANRFQRRTVARKRLEDDWVRASMIKKERLSEDQLRAMSPGMLLHEQCDKYGRCAQCKRTVKNCGESNLWSESRYIPGSRLMV